MREILNSYLFFLGMYGILKVIYCSHGQTPQYEKWYIIHYSLLADPGVATPPPLFFNEAKYVWLNTFISYHVNKHAFKIFFQVFYVNLLSKIS